MNNLRVKKSIVVLLLMQLSLLQCRYLLQLRITGSDVLSRAGAAGSGNSGNTNADRTSLSYLTYNSLCKIFDGVINEVSMRFFFSTIFSKPMASMRKLSRSSMPSYDW